MSRNLMHETAGAAAGSGWVSSWLAPSARAFVLIALLMPATSLALPNFAREYEKGCGMCHTQVPRLNRKGYEFRLAGLRFPDEIGQKEAFDLAQTTAARMQMGYSASSYKDVDPANNDSSSELGFNEISLFPLSGSWGGNFSSITELSIGPDEGIELEKAFIRGVYGDENGWWQGRLGLVHAWEGFGASDRPVGLFLPLFQASRATGSPYTPWGFNEMVLEVGYYFATTGTSLSAAVGNGILWKEDGSGTGEPAQGGDLVQRRDLPAGDAESFRLVFNQFLNDESSITLIYYETAIPSPNPYDANGNELPGPFTQDSLDRLAVYVNYYLVPKTVNLSVGYGTGSDRLDDPSLAPTVGDSSGYFSEIDWFPIEGVLAVGARYDAFDPSDAVDRDNLAAWSVFANCRVVEGLQVVGEFQRMRTEAGATPGENVDDRLAIRVIFTW